jgi:hypothetical protein
MLDDEEAGCAGPGDNPSATFGASMTLGLERGSEGSFGSRGGPLAVALASMRRGGAGRAIGGGGGGCKPIFVEVG